MKIPSDLEKLWNKIWIRGQSVRSAPNRLGERSISSCLPHSAEISVWPARSSGQKILRLAHSYLSTHATTNFILEVFRRNLTFLCEQMSEYVHIANTKPQRSLVRCRCSLPGFWSYELRQWWWTFMHENVHFRLSITFTKFVVAERYTTTLGAGETSEQDLKV